MNTHHRFFLCPITGEVMDDPVVIANGSTYERKAIENWFKNNDTDPKTGQKLSNTTLTPNDVMRIWIEEHIKKENHDLNNRDQLERELASVPLTFLRQALKDFKKQTARDLQKRLLNACLDGDMKTVRALRSEGADFTLRDVDGNTPFTAAVYSGYLPLVDYIVEEIRKQDPRYHPNYADAAKTNFRNFGCPIWKYPPSNIEETTINELANWFEKLNDKLWVQVEYNSTFPRENSADNVSEDKAASWKGDQIWLKALIDRGAGRNSFITTYPKHYLPEELEYFQRASEGFINLDTKCRGFAKRLEVRGCTLPSDALDSQAYPASLSTPKCRGL